MGDPGCPRVSATLLVRNEEEYLPFCLQAIEPAVDEILVMDNGSTDRTAEIARAFPKVKLMYSESRDFGALRNQLLQAATGDWLLVVDADEIFYADLPELLPALVRRTDVDAYVAFFYHFMRGFWQVQNEGERDGAYYQRILVRRHPGLRYRKPVHEELVGIGPNNMASSGLTFAHYGYAKPQREVFRRWQLYAELMGQPDLYAGLDPDHILDDRKVRPFYREHPPVIRDYIAAREPRGYVPMTGIILTTCNDADLLPACLDSLAASVRLPYRLVAVDSGSADGTLDFLAARGIKTIALGEDRGLSAALNAGIRALLADPWVTASAWIHTDMTFAAGWLDRLLEHLADRPSIGKLIPFNIQSPEEWARGDWPAAMRDHSGEQWPGNGCPWVMPRAAVEQTGYFDERYQGAAGLEDWDHNQMVLRQGYRVMITRGSVVFHPGMVSRSRRPDNFGTRTGHNARLYWEKWHTHDPPV